jgi:hypothetical protein
VSGRAESIPAVPDIGSNRINRFDPYTQNVGIVPVIISYRLVAEANRFGK